MTTIGGAVQHDRRNNSEHGCGGALRCTAVYKGSNHPGVEGRCSNLVILHCICRSATAIQPRQGSSWIRNGSTQWCFLLKVAKNSGTDVQTVGNRTWTCMLQSTGTTRVHETSVPFTRTVERHCSRALPISRLVDDDRVSGHV